MSSKRQNDRAERLYAFWAPRFNDTDGIERLEAAFDYLRARVNDLPKKQRPAVFDLLTEELVNLAETVLDQPVHTFTSQRRVNHGGSQRAQSRASAPARETQF